MDIASDLQTFTAEMLPQIETGLKAVVAEIDTPALKELYTMLMYHLGWEVSEAGKTKSGKRIRPLLLLLSTAAVGGDWERALPAATSLELVHNFSLIHDDIQDNSPMRRGQPALWKKWGIPQAINAGDTMYSLAYRAMLQLSLTTSEQTTLRATSILLNACLRLTEGQYLDLAYETQTDISTKDYYLMIGRKTASLISAATEIGALIASGDEKTIATYRKFGYELGLAFQIQDDLLGIWGNSAITGKSNESDLVTGKKSLPVVYALSLNRDFAYRWHQGNIRPEEVSDLAKLLEKEGVMDYGKQEASHHTDNALKALEDAQLKTKAFNSLRSLTLTLLQRLT